MLMHSIARHAPLLGSRPKMHGHGESQGHAPAISPLRTHFSAIAPSSTPSTSDGNAAPPEASTSRPPSPSLKLQPDFERLLDGVLGEFERRNPDGAHRGRRVERR